MKDAKTFPLLFLSLLLLLLAALILLYTWGYYQFYYKQPAEIHTPKQITDKSLTNLNNDYRDSLQKIYLSTLTNLKTDVDTKVENAPAVPLNSQITTEQLLKLRNEIELILKNHPLKADLDIARQKIVDLQKKLTELNNQNINVVDENNRLNGKLSQLANEIKGVQQKVTPALRENNILPKTTETNTVFTVSRLSVAAIRLTDGGEQETTKAEQTEKFGGTITLTSNSAQINNPEIMVVVVQPDGRIMQGSPWESGTFDTREGRKIYSAKVRFEYTTGETRRLSFNISSDTYQKGVYTVQVYHNGMIIGKTTKFLS